MTPTERLARMVETERFTAASITEAVEELADVREWASALETLADALESLPDAVETWAEAERADKADARAEVVAALEAAADAYLDVTALAPMGLGPEVTP